jgi:hypothetical protein
LLERGGESNSRSNCPLGLWSICTAQERGAGAILLPGADAFITAAST